MSRVGKNPVALPQGVSVTVGESRIEVKGKLGTVEAALSQLIEVTQAEGKLWVKPRNQTKEARMLWGTTRANLQNMVEGVSKGFVKNLDIEGVGFRAAVAGKNLQLQLGFSHDVNYPIPEGITIKCEKPTMIAVSGFDRQRVGQVAAELRALKKPEPYKGKGIRYSDEKILRKEGKKK
ncbi:MAG TPA: 50S ribosomal protein L6 [Dongiaceae bacterium]|jgi:large subunit ribosomal protein L6|nr:50S ribosomal protein L6 [Dongiaceae bacterium]